MLLPSSVTAVLIVLILSLVGWGCWPIFFKFAKKARFEFFAYDFAWGMGVAALVAAFLLGSWNSSDLTFQDNFLLASKRQMVWVIGSGALFAVANTLLLGAVAICGMSIAFPIAFGVAWAVGSLSDYFIYPGLNPMMAFGGPVVMLAGAVICIMAHRWYLQDQAEKALAAYQADPTGKPPRSRTGVRGYGLAILAGLVFSGFFYSLRVGTEGETGVASYGAALLVAGGAFVMTALVVPFFVNFPVRGKPLEVRQYLTIELGHHVKGFLAGLLWMTGLVAGLTVSNAAASAQPTHFMQYGWSHAAPLAALIVGVFVAREARGATIRVHMMLVATFVLLLAGMGMVALAPGYGR